MQKMMCLTCKHLKTIYLNPKTLQYKWECEAFKEIPEKYLSGFDEHIESDGEDNGIVYEPNVVDGVIKEMDVKIKTVERK